ncbi:hypothetical protein MASR2M79_21030 [Aminivibrio sp.]
MLHNTILEGVITDDSYKASRRCGRPGFPKASGQGGQFFVYPYAECLKDPPRRMPPIFL